MPETASQLAQPCDPAALIDASAMNHRQWIVIALMVLLNAIDGFDVLASAFAAPGISAEWGIARASLGVVLSAELVGMGLGSVLMGGAADRLGRKPVLLACLAIMAAGMGLAGMAGGLVALTCWRLLTGVGIGGLLATTNAVTAESSNAAHRSVAVALYVSGYPVGAVIGGLVAQKWLLAAFDWRAVFLFGAVVTAILVPLVAWLVPETPAFHAARRAPDALARINRSLAVFGKPPITALPHHPSDRPPARIADLFAVPDLRRITVMLALGYMCHTLTFYFILKWAVQVVADYPPGYSPPEAASVLTFASLGGAIGGLLFGFVTKRFGIRWPTAAALVLGAGATIWFGLGHQSIDAWRAATFVSAFFTNAAIVGFYAALARCFPADLRATGTGFALGVGRLGAAGSPILAGLLFDWLGKEQLAGVATVMAAGSLLALIPFLAVPLREPDGQPATA